MQLPALGDATGFSDIFIELKRVTLSLIVNKKQSALVDNA